MPGLNLVPQMHLGSCKANQTQVGSQFSPDELQMNSHKASLNRQSVSSGDCGQKVPFKKVMNEKYSFGFSVSLAVRPLHCAL